MTLPESIDPFDAKKLVEAFQAMKRAEGAWEAMVNYVAEKHGLSQGDLLGLTAAISRKPPEPETGSDQPRIERVK